MRRNQLGIETPKQVDTLMRLTSAHARREELLMIPLTSSTTAQQMFVRPLVHVEDPHSCAGSLPTRWRGTDLFTRGLIELNNRTCKSANRDLQQEVTSCVKQLTICNSYIDIQGQSLLPVNKAYTITPNDHMSAAWSYFFRITSGAQFIDWLKKQKIRNDRLTIRGYWIIGRRIFTNVNSQSLQTYLRSWLSNTY